MTPLAASPPRSNAHPLRVLLFLLIAHFLALACLSYLLAHKQRSLRLDLAVSQAEISMTAIRSAMIGAAQAGLEAAEMQPLHSQLDLLPGAATGIQSIRMFAVNADGATGIVHSTDNSPMPMTDDSALAKALAQPASRWVAASEGRPQLVLTIQDHDGAHRGGLLVTLDPQQLRADAERFEDALHAAMTKVSALSAGALIVIFALFSRSPQMRRWLALLLMLPTLLAAGALASGSARQLAGSLEPALAAKTGAVAEMLAGRIARAIDLGIPADKLVGTAEYFADIRQRNPDIASIVLSIPAGTTTSGDATGLARIAQDGQAIGEVAVTPDRNYAYRALWAIAADIAVVLLATLLAFRELLAAVVTAPEGQATDEGWLTVQSLRLPLFLFILSEEITRAILPLFFRDAGIENGLGASLAAGLPISIYMIFFAAMTPYAGGWADRFGPTRVFALGAALCVAGFGWMALAAGYWPLLIARALCAAGYALGTMACQRQIIALTADTNRTRGLALFVSAVSIAAICGAAVGGVLAERMGVRNVLLLAAGCALAGFVVFLISRQAATPLPKSVSVFRWRDLVPLLQDRRFMRLMLGAAIPAKIALAGFLFYLTPLALHAEAYSAAAIGRAIMAYYILLTLSNPLASMIADRWRQPRRLVAAGMLLTAIGTLAGLTVPLLAVDLAFWIGIVCLGLGTGLSAAPMQTLAVDIAGDGNPTPVLVALRTLERLGSVIGPLIAAGLLAWLPYPLVMTALGAITFAGALLLVTGRPRQETVAA